MRFIIIALMMVGQLANAADFPNPMVTILYDQPSGIVTLVEDVFTSDPGNVWAIEGFDSDGFRSMWMEYRPTTKREIEIGTIPPWCLQATVSNGYLKAVSSCIRF